jgi:hypothetical protein
LAIFIISCLGRIFEKRYNPHMTTKRPAKRKPGPKPQILKIHGDWQEAVKRSFQKKRPATGWPK